MIITGGNVVAATGYGFRSDGSTNSYSSGDHLPAHPRASIDISSDRMKVERSQSIRMSALVNHSYIYTFGYTIV